MNECVSDYDVLEECIKDIFSLIKPVEDDQNKRLSAIQELADSIQSVAALRGAAIKPFGSFVSNLYSKSGDLDVSVQLGASSNLPISKQKKQSVLRELKRALQVRGVARHMQFIPQARVPVLQYMSNRFGISCDLSVDNYPGRIKSKIFYWINTLDERFGDMVLLIKEWAKAQNINDPKTGTLNSYSLCLLVLFHFQTCEPAILPPLKNIYEGKIAEDFAELTFYNEEHLDEVCKANIARLKSHNKEQRNESSLCHLLATFFHKFSHIDALSSDVISTFTGQFKQIQDIPSWTGKSYSLFVEDPVERPDNAARAVGVKGLLRIASAFRDASRKFVSLEHTDRNDLLALLCTPGVGSKLGGIVIANPYTNTPQKSHQHARSMGRVAAKPSDNQRHHGARGFTGSRSVRNPQVHTTGRQQTAGQSGPRQNHDRPQVHTTGRQQTAGQSGLYQNHHRPQVYAAGRQTAGLYQNHNHPQVYTTWVPTAGPYQNLHHPQPQVYATGLQTPGPYQNHSHPQVYTSSLQTPGPYQNYNHPPLYSTGRQTGGSYQNHQVGKHASGRQTSRNAVTAKDEPVLGGFQNGPAWDSRSQASSSRTARQRELPMAPPKTDSLDSNRVPSASAWQ